MNFIVGWKIYVPAPCSGWEWQLMRNVKYNGLNTKQYIFIQAFLSLMFSHPQICSGALFTASLLHILKLITFIIFDGEKKSVFVHLPFDERGAVLSELQCLRFIHIRACLLTRRESCYLQKRSLICESWDGSEPESLHEMKGIWRKYNTGCVFTSLQCYFFTTHKIIIVPCHFSCWFIYSCYLHVFKSDHWSGGLIMIDWSGLISIFVGMNNVDIFAVNYWSKCHRLQKTEPVYSFSCIICTQGLCCFIYK